MNSIRYVPRRFLFINTHGDMLITPHMVYCQPKNKWDENIVSFCANSPQLLPHSPTELFTCKVLLPLSYDRTLTLTINKKLELLTITTNFLKWVPFVVFVTFDLSFRPDPLMLTALTHVTDMKMFWQQLPSKLSLFYRYWHCTVFLCENTKLLSLFLFIPLSQVFLVVIIL